MQVAFIRIVLIFKLSHQLARRDGGRTRIREQRRLVGHGHRDQS